MFDSGVGGLSVLAALRQRLPGCDFVFACDNAAFPYGTKSEAELIDRVDRVVRQLVHHLAPELVVVACNSASTVALPRLRQHLALPVVGVVPAIKPAAQLAHQGHRPAGHARHRAPPVHPAADRRLRPRLRGDSTGQRSLVEIAERALRGTPPDPGELRDLLAPLFAVAALDTVVLACTHFPLLTAALAAAAPRPLRWIDSGDAIARRVASLLPGWQAAADAGFRACFTSPAGIGALYPALADLGCTAVAIRDAEGGEHALPADFPAAAAR